MSARGVLAGVLGAFLVLVACGASAPEASDSAPDSPAEAPAGPPFDPTSRPALFDAGHRNFHTANGTYASFVDLLEARGPAVGVSSGAFTADGLAGVGLVVIVNARGAEAPAAPAFSEAELDALEAWVEAGGRLLLVADHQPFGTAAAPLAARFGVRMYDGHVRDASRRDPVFGSDHVFAYTPGDGLAPHPITAGLERVVTFSGQALEITGTASAGTTSTGPADDRATDDRAASGSAVAILTFSDAAVLEDDTSLPEAERTRRGVGGLAQAVALERGRGRVVILGEAAVFTDQVITGADAAELGAEEVRLGFAREDTDNRRFAARVLDWLLDWP